MRIPILLFMNEKQAIELLRKYSIDKESFKIVLEHSKTVQRTALRIAEKIAQHHPVNIKFIKIACILHDIGRFNCPPGPKTIFHGLEGGKILLKEGLPEYASVAETHLGVGITKEDIIKQNLPLPHRDFVPQTMEEEIIAYADTLTEGKNEITPKKAVERFRKEINEECAQRILALHKKLLKLENS